MLVTGVVLAVVLRMFIWSAVEYRTDVGDARSYLQAARNIVEWGTYSDSLSPPIVPTAYRPPGYSALIAVLLAIFDDVGAIQIAQLLLSLLTVLLTTRIATKLSPDASLSVFALLCLSPYEAVYSGAILSETLCGVLFVVSAWAVIEGRPWWPYVSGVAAGLVCLTRDVYLPLFFSSTLLFLAISLVFRPQSRRQALHLLLSLTCCVAPWSIRNAITAGTPSLSQGRLGFALWVGSWATDTAWSLGDSTGLPRQYPSEAFLDAAERSLIEASLAAGDAKAADPYMRASALRRWSSEPVRTFGRCIYKIPMLWLGTRFDIFPFRASFLARETLGWRLTKYGLWALNFGMVSSALGGLVLALRRRGLTLLLAAPLVYTVCVYFPINTMENRYSKPVEPFVTFFAGTLLSAVYQAASRTGRNQRPRGA
jgi:hypothetical protein